jgi:hypothetical protein
LVQTGKLKIKISEIEEVRIFQPKHDWYIGGYIYGQFLLKPAVMVIFKKSTLNRLNVKPRRVYLTPDDVDLFIGSINESISRIASPLNNG